MTWPTKTDFVDGDVLTAAQVNNIGTNLNEADPTGITDGFVLTADGAGGMAWEAAGGAVEVLASTQASGSVNTITFSSIPSTSRNLKLVIGATTQTANGTLRMRFNNDSGGTSYFLNYIAGSNSVVNASRSPGFSSIAIANMKLVYPVAIVIDIPDYAGSTYKTLTECAAYDDGTTGGYTWIRSATWNSTAAINRIDLFDDNSNNFASTSTFTLYGYGA